MRRLVCQWEINLKKKKDKHKHIFNPKRMMQQRIIIIFWLYEHLYSEYIHIRFKFDVLEKKKQEDFLDMKKESKYFLSST